MLSRGVREQLGSCSRGFRFLCRGLCKGIETRMVHSLCFILLLVESPCNARYEPGLSASLVS